MSNNLVIKVGDVQRTIGPLTDIHRPKPGIGRDQEIRFFLRDDGRTMINGRIAIDSTRHHVSTEEITLILFGKLFCRNNFHTGNRGRTMQVIHHRFDKSQPIMGFPETRIVTTSQNLVDRFGVTVRGKQVSFFIKGGTKGIYLSVSEVLNPRTIQPHPVGVPRLHLNDMPVTATHASLVIESMVRIQPAIQSPPK